MGKQYQDMSNKLAACQKNDVQACYEVGKAYAADGTDTEVKVRRIKYFYKMACDGGVAKACDEMDKLPE